MQSNERMEIPLEDSQRGRTDCHREHPDEAFQTGDAEGTHVLARAAIDHLDSRCSHESPDWNFAREWKENVLCLRDSVRLLRRRHPDRIGDLLETENLDVRMVRFLKKECSPNYAVVAGPTTSADVTTCHVLAEFFPASTSDEFTESFGELTRNILAAGWHPGAVSADETFRESTSRIAKTVLPVAFDICRTTNDSTALSALLFKILYFVLVLSPNDLCVRVEELIELIKVMIFCSFEDSVTLSLAMARLLMTNYIGTLYKEKLHLRLAKIRPTVRSMVTSGRCAWIREVYMSLTVHLIDDRGASISRELLETNAYFIDSRLKHVLINCKSLYSDTNKRLRRLIDEATSVRTNCSWLVSNPRSDWKECFKTLVTKAVVALDSMLIHRGYFDYTPDMYEEEAFHDYATSPEEIASNAVAIPPSVRRVVGHSKCPEELSRNPFVGALRYLSMLDAANRHLATTIDPSAERGPIIPERFFHSSVMSEFVSGQFNRSDGLFHGAKAEILICIAKDYPFLLSFRARRSLFRHGLAERFLHVSRRKKHQFVVPRTSVVHTVAKKLDKMSPHSGSYWEFQFLGEIAKGPGPTKEFYTEFSRDCQRHELGLWMGEPGEEINGLRYTMAEGSGLFPRPDEMQSTQRQLFVVVGLIMAKSLLDGQQLDINFSEAFYERLFKADLDSQHLSAHDFKEIMPGLDKFLRDLREALREKSKIEGNDFLTEEDKREAIARIECGGASFEDLCIVFTVPGYPHLEMKEGGKDVLLTINNAEEYVRLAIWWLLHFGPRMKLQSIKQGFENIMPVRYLKMFYSHEFQYIFCGDEDKQWTVKSLNTYCALKDGFTTSTPVIRNLFNVLCSLSAAERKLFLHFVTSTPRLPTGGLEYMSPKLTIRRQMTNANPDLYFPRARTCFNELYIAEYSNRKTLRRKLLTALVEGGNHFQLA